MEIDTKDEITIKNMLPRVTMWRTPVAEECLKYFKQHHQQSPLLPNGLCLLFLQLQQ